MFFVVKATERLNTKCKVPAIEALSVDERKYQYCTVTRTQVRTVAIYCYDERPERGSNWKNENRLLLLEKAANISLGAHFP